MKLLTQATDWYIEREFVGFKETIKKAIYFVYF